MNPTDTTWRHLLPGVILITLGALFLADKFFYWNVLWYFGVWWPSLLIAFGVFRLLERPRRPVGPFVLITIGVILQVDRLDIFSWWSMHQLWPVILIAIGVGLILCRMQSRRFHSASSNGPSYIPPGGVEVKS